MENTNDYKNCDILGNNAAFVCPICGKVFIVSAYLSAPKNEKKYGEAICPNCKKSTAKIEEIADKKYKASISTKCINEGTE